MSLVLPGPNPVGFSGTQFANPVGAGNTAGFFIAYWFLKATGGCKLAYWPVSIQL